MHGSSRLGIRLVIAWAVAFGGACGSGDDSNDTHTDGGKDAAPDVPAMIADAAKDASVAEETFSAAEAAQASDGAVDAAANDAAVGTTDAAGATDAAATGIDGTSWDTMGIDGASTETGGTTDVRNDAAPSETGTPLDSAADGFVPGPATAIVVNSANTATYNLADGTWKVFYFDATASQLYCISDLSGITRGYVSTSPSVSPTSYQYASSSDGTLAFTATATQRYYVAVAATGGGASGSFQVADGGKLLALGANTVTLPAPDADNYYFFRFPISAGHGYTLSVTGPSSPSVGVGVSPHAERSSNGQLASPAWGLSSPLPISDQVIAAASVALSYSGYYFFFLRVPSAMTVTVTLTQGS